MPKFEPDFENTTVNTLILDKGDYELKLGKPFGFANYKKDDDGDTTTDISCGVKFPLQVVGKINSRGQTEEVEGLTGENISMLTLWIHNQGSLKATKRVLMGILGYDKKQEDEFNAWYKSQDFSVDTGDEDDDGKFPSPVVGESWKNVEGTHARVSLSKKYYQPKGGAEPEEQQEFRNWKSAQQTASV